MMIHRRRLFHRALTVDGKIAIHLRTLAYWENRLRISAVVFRHVDGGTVPFFVLLALADALPSLFPRLWLRHLLPAFLPTCSFTSQLSLLFLTSFFPPWLIHSVDSTRLLGADSAIFS